MPATVPTAAEFAAVADTVATQGGAIIQHGSHLGELDARVTALEADGGPITPPVDPPPVDPGPTPTDPRLPSSTAINVPAGMWLPAVRDAKNGDQLAMPAGVTVLSGDVTTALAAKSIEIVPQAGALLPANADGTYPRGSLAILEAQGAEFYWYATGSAAGAHLAIRDVTLRANTTGSPSGSEHGSALLAPMSGIAELLATRVAWLGDKDMKAGQQLCYVAPHAVGSSVAGAIGSITLDDNLLDGLGTTGFGLQVYGPGMVSSVTVRRSTVRGFPARPGLMAWTTIQSYLVDECDFSGVVYIFRNETATPTRITNCRGTYLASDGPFTGAGKSRIVAANNSFAPGRVAMSDRYVTTHSGLDYGPRPVTLGISYHMTEGNGGVGDVVFLTKRGNETRKEWAARVNGVSAHVVLTEDGTLYQMLDFDRACGNLNPADRSGEYVYYGHHHLVDVLGDYWKNPNAATVSMEIAGKRADGPTDAQRIAAIAWGLDMRRRYPSIRGSIGHHDQSPKPCPGLKANMRAIFEGIGGHGRFSTEESTDMIPVAPDSKAAYSVDLAKGVQLYDAAFKPLTKVSVAQTAEGGPLTGTGYIGVTVTTGGRLQLVFARTNAVTIREAAAPATATYTVTVGGKSAGSVTLP